MICLLSSNSISSFLISFKWLNHLFFNFYIISLVMGIAPISFCSVNRCTAFCATPVYWLSRQGLTYDFPINSMTLYQPSYSLYECIMSKRSCGLFRLPKFDNRIERYFNHNTLTKRITWD